MRITESTPQQLSSSIEKKTPPEIVPDILKEIFSWLSEKDLWNVMLVNKTWNASAKKTHLFKRIQQIRPSLRTLFQKAIKTTVSFPSELASPEGYSPKRKTHVTALKHKKTFRIREWDLITGKSRLLANWKCKRDEWEDGCSPKVVDCANGEHYIFPFSPKILPYKFEGSPESQFRAGISIPLSYISIYGDRYYTCTESKCAILGKKAGMQEGEYPTVNILVYNFSDLAKHPTNVPKAAINIALSHYEWRGATSPMLTDDAIYVARKDSIYCFLLDDPSAPPKQWQIPDTNIEDIEFQITALSDNRIFVHTKNSAYILSKHDLEPTLIRSITANDNGMSIYKSAVGKQHIALQLTPEGRSLCTQQTVELYSLGATLLHRFSFSPNNHDEQAIDEQAIDVQFIDSLSILAIAMVELKWKDFDVEDSKTSREITYYFFDIASGHQLYKYTYDRGQNHMNHGPFRTHIHLEGKSGINACYLMLPDSRTTNIDYLHWADPDAPELIQKMIANSTNPSTTLTIVESTQNCSV